MNHATPPTPVTSPHDCYCDVVMKGGITSGIIYPAFVHRLAKYYRFKNIGGTSAGAIAAVATAAAEYHRRHHNNETAFEELAKLPEQLGATVEGTMITKLFSLFQPAPECRRLFKVLTTALNATGGWHRAFKITWGMLSAYWLATVVSALIAAIAGYVYGLHAGLFLLPFLLLVIIGAWVTYDITRNLVANNYGMCTGMGVTGGQHEALTPWLHKLIQSLSGRADCSEPKPLTFGDLWDAPGFPPDWLKKPPDEKTAKDEQPPIRSIDLRMFTTSLSLGRPFVLPLTANETCRLFYLEAELEKFMPADVMKFIVEKSKNYAPNPEYPDSDPAVGTEPPGLKELPAAKDFPILLAARMSLSFPLLFAAIPLWAINYNHPRGSRDFQRCLFSDGGISSNFPMHLFDGLLPLWPTFGIQLEPKLADRANMVYLPSNYFEGFGERWNRFPGKPKSSTSRIGWLFAAIFDAMQNWNDNTVSRMPGVRDRVVRVRLNDDEGGLNLNMDTEKIRNVAARGGEAAYALIARFLSRSSCGSQLTGWDEQRWVRLAVVLRMLHKRFAGVESALQDRNIHTKHYDDLIKLGQSEVLPGEKAVLTTAEVEELLDLLTAMSSFNSALAKSSTAFKFEAIPESDLKVRPSL